MRPITVILISCILIGTVLILASQPPHQEGITVDDLLRQQQSILDSLAALETQKKTLENELELNLKNQNELCSKEDLPCGSNKPIEIPPGALGHVDKPKTQPKKIVQKPVEKIIVTATKVEAKETEYATDREEHLYNEVKKTVDLPGFGDYQDLLASYAYNTCRKALPSEQGKYSCQNLVLTWNAENGAWNFQASGVTNDKGLCQLNPRYHKKFINGDWFDNPLAQLDYCLDVWEDAKKKGTMPRYAYAQKDKRNKGIEFLE